MGKKIPKKIEKPTGRTVWDFLAECKVPAIITMGLIGIFICVAVLPKVFNAKSDQESDYRICQAIQVIQGINCDKEFEEYKKSKSGDG
jgi:hypothetical protein